ncbi:MAG: hypothetical protein KDK97_12090 [Verrucomicrobiales bacterium]|nr:hypothetical protein [Verrucomicrobiales bacterium]
MLYTARLDLREQIDWLIPRLPDQREIVLRGEADYYGASAEIAAAVGLAEVPLASGTWLHGWTYLNPTMAEAMAGYKPSSRVHLMNKSVQQDFLRDAGYPNAFAVGLPVLYAKSPDVERRPRSLLLAPFHSLPEVTPHEDQKRNEEAFCEYALGLRGQFDCICACLHASCVKTGQWIETFEQRGIPWVTGAMTSDANALRRVRVLFASFESVLTNQLTSVVPYSAVNGAKVSIAGPTALFPPIESFAQHPYYQKHPELLKNFALRHPDRLKGLYPELFVEPSDAICPRDWAESELGVPLMVRHEDVARLLGWRLVDGDPVWEGVDRRKAVSLFGWLPSSFRSLDTIEKVGQLLDRDRVTPEVVIEHLKAQREAAKKYEKISKAGNSEQVELERIKSSWAWRCIAKPLYAIEKRLRGKK